LKKLKLKEIEKHLNNYELDKALNEIFVFIEACNKYVQDNELWKSRDKKKLYELADSIKAIAILLWPYIPESSEKIAKTLGFEISNLEQISEPLVIKKIKKAEILFKKIDIKEVGKLREKEVKKGKMENFVSYNDWSKIDLRVGKILSVKPHPNAERLVLLEIDLGTEKRTLVAGLKDFYKDKELKGRQCIVFTNLEPKELRGVKSEGMILAAVNDDKSQVILIAPEKTAELGSKVE
jgi:methionyl-tRNA synthetase